MVVSLRTCAVRAEPRGSEKYVVFGGMPISRANDQPRDNFEAEPFFEYHCMEARSDIPITTVFKMIEKTFVEAPVRHVRN